MKRLYLFICIVLMMCIARTSMAQSDIDDAFQSVIETYGIKKSVSERTIEQIDEDGKNSGKVGRVKIIDIRVGKPDFRLFTDLIEAFEADKEDAYMSQSCYEPISDKNTRNIWKIQSGHGDDILVGQEKNSSYVIMCFNDPQNAGYRTVYSAEWWETNDPDIRQGRLVYSYGLKPKWHTDYSLHFISPHHENLDSMLNIVPNLRSFNNLHSQFFNDSLYVENIERYKDEIARIQNYSHPGIGLLPPDRLSDISFLDDTKTWARNALQRINKLSPSDWNRLFGILTEEMLRTARAVNGRRDLIVSAGLVLDLCKNAPAKLDEDEREVYITRLNKIANSLGEENEYVRDILKLCAIKLEH